MDLGKERKMLDLATKILQSGRVSSLLTDLLHSSASKLLYYVDVNRRIHRMRNVKKIFTNINRIICNDLKFPRSKTGVQQISCLLFLTFSNIKSSTTIF